MDFDLFLLGLLWLGAAIGGLVLVVRPKNPSDKGAFCIVLIYLTGYVGVIMIFVSLVGNK